MIVKPKIRGFICTTAHPEGCKALVKSEIDYVKSQNRKKSFISSKMTLAKWI